MGSLILNRIGQGLVTVLLLTVMIFVLTRATGDPVALMAAEESMANRSGLETRLGLDKPLHEQFGSYIWNLAHGDLGNSFRYGRPVTEIFFDRFWNSLVLVVPSFAVAILLAIPLGVVAAKRRGTALGKVTSVVAVLGIATPNFWLGMVLIFFFSVLLGWFPSSRMGGLDHYVLPVVTLATTFMAGIMRLIRSSMLEELDTEYVKLARTKGVSESSVVWHHALRNSLLPAVSFIGTYAALVITGTTVVETVFAWPGSGRLLYESVIQRDFPVVQGIIVIGGVLIVMITFVSDILYAWLDPRIR